MSKSKSKTQRILFHSTTMNKYIKPNLEVRIDYFAVWISGCIIPILYYNYKQECRTAHNKLDMHADYPFELLEKYEKEIQKKIWIIEKMFNSKIENLELHGNFHTHPIGISSFSCTDFNGCLQPEKDFIDEPMIGSNYLLYFNKTPVKALERHYDGSHCKYKPAKLSISNIIEPIDCVDESLFIEKQYKYQAITVRDFSKGFYGTYSNYYDDYYEIIDKLEEEIKQEGFIVRMLKGVNHKMKHSIKANLKKQRIKKKRIRDEGGVG